MTVARPALDGMGDFQDSKEALERQLAGLSIEQTDERCVLLLGLAELSVEDPAAQAAYMQQMYELRLKSVAAAIQGTAAQESCAQAGQAAAPANQHASSSQNSSSSSSSSADWDASDEWEPDVSCLRSATSFERQRDKPVLLQPFQSSPHPQGLSAGFAGSTQPTRLALSEPSHSVRASSGGGSSRPVSSAGGSKPRGRGQSKCGLPSSDSEDEALLIAAQSQPHIVEIHGLTRSVSTAHLETFLLDYIWGKTAANIKWVDDEHALAVFPCAEAAQVLLESPQRDYKVRPYTKASRAALHISAEELAPPRSFRPKTTTAVARRLISNALGNREVRDKAAEKELAELRKANKEGRKERQQQLDAAWGEDD